MSIGFYVHNIVACYRSWYSTKVMGFWEPFTGSGFTVQGFRVSQWNRNSGVGIIFQI